MGVKLAESRSPECDTGAIGGGLGRMEGKLFSLRVKLVRPVNDSDG